VTPGETLSPGNALRFEVRAEGQSGYVAVLSRDAAPKGVSVGRTSFVVRKPR
jgi:hypothetical protein